MIDKKYLLKNFLLLFYKSTTVKLFLQLKIPNAQKKPNKNCGLKINN